MELLTGLSGGGIGGVMGGVYSWIGAKLKTNLANLLVRLYYVCPGCPRC